MTARPPDRPTDWFQEYVIRRLDEGADRFDRMEKKLDALCQTVPRLDERTRITAVIFGVLGGFLPALGAVIYLALRHQ